MSVQLTVRLRGRVLNEVEERDLQDYFGCVLAIIDTPGAAAAAHLNLATSATGSEVEPFVRSKELAALLRRRSERDEGTRFLSVLLGCCLLFHDDVEVRFVDLRAPDTPTGHAALHVPLGDSPQLGNSYEVRAEPVWFHFPRVEVRLLKPLPVTSGQVATHYFRELWVCAVDRPVALAVVQSLVARDAAVIIDHGAMLFDPPRAGISYEGNVAMCGRVYFSTS